MGKRKEHVPAERASKQGHAADRAALRERVKRQTIKPTLRDDASDVTRDAIKAIGGGALDLYRPVVRYTARYSPGNCARGVARITGGSVRRCECSILAGGTCTAEVEMGRADRIHLGRRLQDP